MERTGIGISGECALLSFVERRVAERRMGDRRQGERRASAVNHTFLLLGIACRRTGLDRRMGERRRGERRAGGVDFVTLK
jgi:hypothetical protein